MSSNLPHGLNPPSPPMPPGDESLSAWLDDELDTAQRESVEAWLRADAPDASRVQMWAADRDALTARFADVVDEPVPARLQQAVWKQMPAAIGPSRVWRLAAAVAIFALGLGLGGGVAWRVFGAADGPALASNGWVHRAEIAHAVFAPELRHPVEVAVGPSGTADNRALEAHLAGWLTKRMDQPVKLFDLSAEGYELVGGRLLPDAAGPSAQLMYERRPDVPGQPSGRVMLTGDAKSRVTIYLRKPGRDQPVTDTPVSFGFERRGELNTFYWVEGATGYALVGAVPREQLLALAEAIYRQGR